MSDDVVRLSVLGQIVRGRWRLLVVVAVLGALLGVGASLLLSPGYESASRVLLQGPRDKEELQTETQVAMSSVVLDRTATALGWGSTGEGLRGSVTAEVLEGNVIEIRGSAKSPERAQQLTDRVTEEYLAFSTQLVSGAAEASAQVLQERRDTLQQRVVEINRQIVDLQGAAGEGGQAGAELARLRTTLDDAMTELDRIEGRGQEAEADAAFSRASILVMEPAVRPSGPADPTLTQFIVGGALLFFLLGVFAHLVATRADRRLRSTEQIAAALGAPVVGSVDVPDAPGWTSAPADGSATSRHWSAGLRRLLHADRPWDAPRFPICSNDFDREVRYRRVLARLRGTPGRILARLRGTPDSVLRLLVLIADDDAVAHRAVARLAVAAGVDCGPASVVTDVAGFARMVQAAGGKAVLSNARLTVRPSSDPAPGTHRTVLHVVDFSAARPTVPDCGRVSGALLVLSTGTRTGWELIGITEACADAGYQVLGAFVTHRTQLIDDQPSASTQVGSSTVVPFTSKTMAGSA
ncbi:MAG: exopolysaccharide biosynthesis protein [Pseudonocardiaceae bacterium]